VGSFLAAMSLSCALALPGATAGPTGFELTSAPLDLGDHPMVSRLVLDTGSITAPREPSQKKPKNGKPEAAPVDENAGLGPERAQILLRSLTVPGWGQATLGLNGSAKFFAVIEAGIWGSYIAFRIQEAQRTDSYIRTAKLSAGIDLSQQDDEFRRIVGAFASSDEYNLLVVSRDAANIYLSDRPALVERQHGLAVERRDGVRSLRQPAEVGAEGRPALQHVAGTRDREPAGERAPRGPRRRPHAHRPGAGLASRRGSGPEPTRSVPGRAQHAILRSA